MRYREGKYYLTVPEFAEAAGISKQAVYSKIGKASSGYSVTIAENRYISADALEEFYPDKYEQWCVDCEQEKTRLVNKSESSKTNYRQAQSSGRKAENKENQAVDKQSQAGDKDSQPTVKKSQEVVEQEETSAVNEQNAHLREQIAVKDRLIAEMMEQLQSNAAQIREQGQTIAKLSEEVVGLSRDVAELARQSNSLLMVERRVQIAETIEGKAQDTAGTNEAQDTIQQDDTEDGITEELSGRTERLVRTGKPAPVDRQHEEVKKPLLKRITQFIWG